MGKLFKSLKSQSLAWHIPSTHTTQMHSYPHCTMITTTFHIKNYYPSQVVLRILDEFLSIFGNNQRFIFQVSETLGNPHWENENREQCTSENGKWAPAQKKKRNGRGWGGIRNSQTTSRHLSPIPVLLQEVIVRQEIGMCSMQNSNTLKMSVS